MIDFIERFKLCNRSKNVPVFIGIVHWLSKRWEFRTSKKDLWLFATQIKIGKYYLSKLFSFAVCCAHSGCDTDRWTFLACCSCCNCAGGGSESGCFVLLSVVVLKLSNEKSLCSDGWYDVAGLQRQIAKMRKNFWRKIKVLFVLPP